MSRQSLHLTPKHWSVVLTAIDGPIRQRPLLFLRDKLRRGTSGLGVLEGPEGGGQGPEGGGQGPEDNILPVQLSSNLAQVWRQRTPNALPYRFYDACRAAPGQSLQPPRYLHRPHRCPADHRQSRPTWNPRSVPGHPCRWSASNSQRHVPCSTRPSPGAQPPVE